MNLSSFFSPIDNDFNTSGFTLGQQISKYTNEFPDLNNCNIALIGINKIDEGININVIRKHFYDLEVSRNMKELVIVDLGNLICDNDVNNHTKYIVEIGEYCIKENILPIFLGGGQETSFAQYCIYQQFDKLISVAQIDRTFNFKEQQDEINNENYAHKIITHLPNYLFNYAHLGSQAYLCKHEDIDLMEALRFDRIRLGSIHADIEITEPVLRDADMLTVSVNALNGVFSPGQNKPTPFGITPEQLSQMLWYAGQNEKLTSLGIYDYNYNNDRVGTLTANILAVALWYFIEGYTERKDEVDFVINDYLIFHCPIKKIEEEIVFYKSIRSNKWWFEVKPISTTNHLKRGYMVSCTYEDYLQTIRDAKEGTVPDFYLRSLERLG